MILEDVQSRSDSRGIAIDRVGVRDLRYPIELLDREKGRREAQAAISMAVHLPHSHRGTHMSRFIEVLHEYRDEVTLRTLPRILEALTSRLGASAAEIAVSFPYFLERSAPASGAASFVDYECGFRGSINGGLVETLLSVGVPVTSLCPCSKEISDYGAHNQRGQLTIEIRTRSDESGLPEVVWIEELVELAEACASSPIYTLLKRSDERHVTMKAFENPVFVEDMVRNVALRLQNDSRITWFKVNALNQESIHNHNAFAELEWERPS